MSAAVAHRLSPHHHLRPVVSSSRPSMDSKRSGGRAVKTEEGTDSDAPAVAASDGNSVKSHGDDADMKPAPPLAPPPRPSDGPNNNTNEPDYFSGKHGTQYSLEPNLFEHSFGQSSSQPATTGSSAATTTNAPTVTTTGPTSSNTGTSANPAVTTAAAETPGKSVLPPVASLASPAPLTGNGSLSGGFGWSGSLRSGPLSPAMLSGPTGTGDYFDSIRGAFPTPNESSMRTGLTPGGGGSMFPAPSPNSQSFLNSLVSGGATPSTLEFHRTAVNAAAQQKAEKTFANGAANSGSATAANLAAPNGRSHAAMETGAAGSAAAVPAASTSFGQHDSDAANGLFLLAQAGNETQTSNNQFTSANAPSSSTKQQHRAAGSLGGSVSAGSLGTAPDPATLDEDGDTKSGATRKSKRSTAGKGGSAARRKADEVTPSKAPTSKRGKSNSGAAFAASAPPVDDPMQDEDDSDDEQMNADMEMIGKDGKKMTDEEKRKNFLERNRVAALKCRQRKKQWLANLQHKVEMFGSENDALNAQVAQMREEIISLKSILIAHKDCPLAQSQAHAVAAQQGLGGPYHHAAAGGGAGVGGPGGQGAAAGAGAENGYAAAAYGMAALPPGQQVMAGPRRYS